MFFKQKTAYDRRISDWSSDVCASDLAGLLATGGAICFQLAMQAESKEPFEVNLSDAEWKKRLTPRQYAVLRKAATERPFSSPLNEEHRKGVFLCAGCRLPLFSSGTKFESGTGCPSFWRPLPKRSAEHTSELQSLLRISYAVFCLNK